VCVTCLQDAPITLEGLKLLLSRESAQEPPQTYLIDFEKSDSSSLKAQEQRITDFPHPYPQVLKESCGSRVSGSPRASCTCICLHTATAQPAGPYPCMGMSVDV
jgi:hypothetical protein